MKKKIWLQWKKNPVNTLALFFLYLFAFQIIVSAYVFKYDYESYVVLEDEFTLKMFYFDCGFNASANVDDCNSYKIITEDNFMAKYDGLNYYADKGWLLFSLVVLFYLDMPLFRRFMKKKNG